MAHAPKQPAFLVASNDQDQTVVALPIAPLFSLGEVVSTTGALEAMRAANVSPLALLHRHLRGDWGNLDKHDKQLNDQAVNDGSRIFMRLRHHADRQDMADYRGRSFHNHLPITLGVLNMLAITVPFLEKFVCVVAGNIIGLSRHPDYFEYHYRLRDLKKIRIEGLTKFIRVDSRS